MKKITIILALAVGLSGCVNGQLINPFATFTNPATKDHLAELEAGYGAAASIALGFRNSCAAGNIPTSINCRSIVKQIQNADNYAYGQIQVARKFIKTNPTLDASALLATAQDAVAAFKQAETKNGVQ